jgi:hypothetical protein
MKEEIPSIGTIVLGTAMILLAIYLMATIY